MKYSSLQIAALERNATADNATKGEEEDDDDDKGENISTTNQSGNTSKITPADPKPTDTKPTDSPVKNKMVTIDL